MLFALGRYFPLEGGEGSTVLSSLTLGLADGKRALMMVLSPRPSPQEALCGFACLFAAGPKTSRETWSPGVDLKPTGSLQRT